MSDAAADPQPSLRPPPSERDLDLVVIGAGIAGLTAAWTARRLGWRVRVLEAGRVVGGKIRSERHDGYLVEGGPSSFLGSAATLWRLVDELGLGDQVVRAQPPGTRYVFRDRRARALPMGPGSLLMGDYMSLPGKLRLLAEPFVFGDAREEDSVLAFARRRLGPEAAQYLVTPFVSGVYAGDPDNLGARDAFPRLWQWEHDSGSVVMGALMDWSTRRRDRADEPARAETPKRRGMFNFTDGFASLPRKLAEALPEGSVRTHARVTSLEPVAGGGYEVRFVDTQAPHAPDCLHARRVVVALPARVSAGLLRDGFPGAADALAAVDVCRVAVVQLGGPDPDGIAPRGFGVLIPPGEGLRTLGILFPSSVFPERAPSGHWLHTGFLGGSLDPDVVDLPDERLVSLVLGAQQQAFGHLHPGRELTCTFSNVVRWRDAIPQYRVGHREATERALRAVETGWQGVTLAGNHLQGISVNDAAASGESAIERLARLDSGWR